MQRHIPGFQKERVKGAASELWTREWQRTLPLIRSGLGKLLEQAEPELVASVADWPAGHTAFQVLGCDFVVDAGGTPWLLELNEVVFVSFGFPCLCVLYVSGTAQSVHTPDLGRNKAYWYGTAVHARHGPVLCHAMLYGYRHVISYHMKLTPNVCQAPQFGDPLKMDDLRRCLGQPLLNHLPQALAHSFTKESNKDDQYGGWQRLPLE